MPKPPPSSPGSNRRRPEPVARLGPARLAARMRRTLIRNRGGDGGDRPDYLAWLAARGLWIDGVDWTRATDAQVIARIRAGEPPEPPADDAEGRDLDATILRRLTALAEAQARKRDSERHPDDHGK